MRQLKLHIKENYPKFASIVSKVLRKYWLMKSTESIFTHIYVKNGWSGTESLSGPGSDFSQTVTVIKELPKLIRKLKAKTMLDAPCGDLNWISKIDLDLEKYIGVDIVSELIEQNNNKFRSNCNVFIKLDISKDELPETDIILCRDCFIHLSFKDIIATINNFKKSNSIYLLTTTYIEVLENYDIMTGDLRPINLELPPFMFPKPLQLINEKCTLGNGKYADKCLGLWNLNEIEI